MSDLIKWSGSKDSQAKNIIKYFPKELDTYHEPFLGGGSIFLALLESDIKINRYCLSDINKELIGIYNIIKDKPELLFYTYQAHYDNFNSSDIQHRKDYFAKVRSAFNTFKCSEDFYWIMRTTTNGMPRYNRKEEFNNSCHFSRPGMKPSDVEKIINKYHLLFNSKNIIFNNNSYEEITPSSDDLIYMDPPYENTKGMYFGGFDNSKFINWINNSNCKWILSYDGKVNSTEVEHVSPNYKRKEYLVSGNSSFRRVIGNSSDSIISESLYLNF
jgi:DNA adenine methylase